MSQKFHISKLCIIGVGLIGGSVARALRESNCVDSIVGVGRNLENLQRAEVLGVIDAYQQDPARAVEDADIVLLAVPLGAMRTVFEQIRPHLAAHTVVTDVGSAKQSVIEAASQVFNGLPASFVPGHPIAGTEKSGVDAAFAELFQHRRVILTPLAETDSSALEKITLLWQACGAQVTEMEPVHHDAVLAATSHLPHMLAFALVDTLARMDDSQEIFDYAAGGFRDFTRIASSDPLMWHDICLANREQLVKAMRAFSDDLHRLCDAMEQGDSEFLKTTFTRAKTARDKFCG
ncbi:MAG: prephenate dehydrogenase/arogenate dehydrogenase family protein [Gammaproteobacteria bacterium]